MRAAVPALPRDNWWNTDISAAPVDARSSSYLAFISSDGSRKLHPDFGGAAVGVNACVPD